MELSSSSQHGRIYQNIEVGGHARVLFGDYIDCGSFLNGRPDFTGLYTHSSLRPVSSYVSRPDIERQVCERLPFESEDASVGDECRIVVVWGLGGAGKSQLVLNYVRACRQHYRAVFWIEAGRKETIERDYIQIYKLLFPNSIPANTNIVVDDAISAVKSWLSGQQRKQRCLWVMDSADDIEDQDSPSYIDLHRYLPFLSQLDCIITTRSANAQGLSTEPGIAVAEMSEDEAAQLFKRQARLQQVDRECEEEIRDIVKELGCLALAVTLAASYVSETPRLMSDVRQYLPQYRTQRGRLLSQKARFNIHQYNESVLGTWEVSFAVVERQSPSAAKLLSLLGFINSDDIFLDLFKIGSAARSLAMK